AGDTITVTSESRLALNMAQGGGFVIRLTEVEETGETDIKDLPVKSASSLYVDKASATLHIYADKAIQTVDIYNINGQKMLNMPTGNKEMQQAIHLQSWPKGVYITKIQTETGLDTLKFTY
ncbi:MAG: T9SS type A sorting domain-containing protein, partial [Dysgonamonadaceae bacterium]|nr:T9SS type A sorting domain-containing protein [Dysgonamonadaceae bacterium]